MSLLVVCTGNTCRSVMAGVMLEHLADGRGLLLSVETAGTHAVEGVPPGARTLSALRTVRPLAPALGGSATAAVAHRSRQLRAGDLGRADLVVAMERAHVRHVRRHHPEAAPRTGLLRTLARELAPGPGPLGDRVAALALEDVVLDPGDDVSDPAGHDDDVYAACAGELWTLCSALVSRL